MVLTTIFVRYRPLPFFVIVLSRVEYPKWRDFWCLVPRTKTSGIFAIHAKSGDYLTLSTLSEIFWWNARKGRDWESLRRTAKSSPHKLAFRARSANLGYLMRSFWWLLPEDVIFELKSQKSFDFMGSPKWKKKIRLFRSLDWWPSKLMKLGHSTSPSALLFEASLSSSEFRLCAYFKKRVTCTLWDCVYAHAISNTMCMHMQTFVLCRLYLGALELIRKFASSCFHCVSSRVK